MDGRQIFDDGLLQDPQADADSLQILGTSRHRNINRLQSAIVDDGFLSYHMITWMKGILRLYPGLYMPPSSRGSCPGLTPRYTHTYSLAWVDCVDCLAAEHEQRSCDHA